MTEKSTLIARHRVHHAKGEVANPGETFTVAADLAAKLVASKAAMRAPEREAPAPLPKSGRKGKAAAKPKPEPVAAESEAAPELEAIDLD